MHVDLVQGLLIAAVAANGLLSGASGDQSIKQLPARHRLGSLAFSAYSRASDQSIGVVWYAVLGIGGAILTHSFTTARAAPINLSQYKVRADA